eukprot:TRINITY_DN10420_c0_g1_i1.p3 TRINITY_DN10420_c0_g1~~TRINITY_DN10420_c0_g1_i1.p3  ORF type:complete len:114 (-),score=31.85 TRINITY_DN10420_c0_g1_i1:470-811(-)
MTDTCLARQSMPSATADEVHIGAASSYMLRRGRGWRHGKVQSATAAGDGTAQGAGAAAAAADAAAAAAGRSVRERQPPTAPPSMSASAAAASRVVTLGAAHHGKRRGRCGVMC